jgi:sporadic carbohydrate cluster 2OG-Fe(II) oxygenase
MSPATQFARVKGVSWGIVLGDSFLSDTEREFEHQFLTQGFVIVPSESKTLLQQLFETILSETNHWLASQGKTSTLSSLRESHKLIEQSVINDVRLHLFAWLNSQPDIRVNYYRLASSILQTLVGNELAMQNKVNLSIQQPHDQTSVLEMHSDAWSGDSPFQVVLWVPLTESSNTNAMFLLKPEKSMEAYTRVRSGELTSMTAIQEAYKSELEPIEINFGDILIFDSNCLHGNQLNTTGISRWSLNCRFTSLLAPSITPERRLGSFYTPIIVRPATRMGLRAADALGLIG